jgi:hypothetical protein
MSFDPKNPYVASVAAAPAPAATLGAYPSGLDYMRTYTYLMENPNWVMNVLWGFLCIISTAVIPVLGQLVFMGYQYEVIQTLLTSGGTRYPDFDINRFAEYLSRAIWPFLVSLAVIFPLVIAMWIGMFVLMLLTGAAGAAGGDEVGGAIGIMVFLLGSIAMLSMYVGAIAVLTPLLLRAGLMQEFAGAFDFEWVTDFLKKVWVELLLGTLFLIVTGAVLSMLGFLALCIGMYAAIAVIAFASSHLWYQLYLIYLGRGGKPIPIKLPAPTPA